MKHHALTLLGGLCLSTALSLGAVAQPAIPFESVPDPIHLPNNLYLGEVSGVATNSHGHVFVFNRGNTTGPAYAAAAAQLLEFDAHGNFVREIGRNLYAWSFAHDVKVDRADNVWVTDKGSDLVVEFDPAGKVRMVIGRKQEASDEDTEPLRHPKPPLPPVDGRFRQVTDITWDSAGNSYIADGYINTRVAKVSPTGEWLASWGTPGKGPLQFNTPHSIAIDAQDHIYVADRGNRRIQVLDTQGHFLRAFSIDVPQDIAIQPVIGNRPTPGAPVPDNQLAMPGAPWAICIPPPPHQVLYAADAYPGRIYKLSLDGQLLGTLGTGGRQLKEFGWVHEIACPSENTLWVAELLNWRVQKLVLHPEKAK